MLFGAAAPVGDVGLELARDRRGALGAAIDSTNASCSQGPMPSETNASGRRLRRPPAVGEPPPAGRLGLVFEQLELAGAIGLDQPDEQLAARHAVLDKAGAGLGGGLGSADRVAPEPGIQTPRFRRLGVDIASRSGTTPPTRRCSCSCRAPRRSATTPTATCSRKARRSTPTTRPTTSSAPRSRRCCSACRSARRRSRRSPTTATTRASAATPAAARRAGCRTSSPTSPSPCARPRRADGPNNATTRWGNELLSQEATQGSGGWQALLPDGLGSIRALTNSQGQITNTYDYDAFGNDRTPQPSRATGYGFAGEPVDPSTGLTYLRARYYDPITGRFTARDNLVQGGPGTQGFDRYTYANNNPVNWTDPSGQFLDTIADVGFIAYDAYRLVKDGKKDRGKNLAALGADVGGALIPGATGAGLAAVAGRQQGRTTFGKGRQQGRADAEARLRQVVPRCRIARSSGKDRGTANGQARGRIGLSHWQESGRSAQEGLGGRWHQRCRQPRATTT